MNVVVKRSIRAKRISLRVRQGQVILTVPKGGNLNKAYQFLNSNYEFVQKRISTYESINLNNGASLKICGKEYNIIYSTKYQIKNIILDEQCLIVSAQTKNPDESIIEFLSNHLKIVITDMAITICKELKVTYSRITIRKMYSKWGSCSSSGNLSFCWKLILFDEEILKYVVVHEICHLKEMNHSKNFWNLVESIYPNWRQARLWLKNEGTKIL